MIMLHIHFIHCPSLNLWLVIFCLQPKVVQRHFHDLSQRYGEIMVVNLTDQVDFLTPPDNISTLCILTILISFILWYAIFTYLLTLSTIAWSWRWIRQSIRHRNGEASKREVKFFLRIDTFTWYTLRGLSLSQSNHWSFSVSWHFFVCLDVCLAFSLFNLFLHQVDLEELLVNEVLLTQICRIWLPSHLWNYKLRQLGGTLWRDWGWIWKARVIKQIIILFGSSRFSSVNIGIAVR